VAELRDAVTLKWLLKTTTVLLVEDSKFLKLANERMLSKAGYSVLNASDGEDALRLAREKIPDISCWTCCYQS